MNEKIEKIVIQCIKLEHTELTYMQVENVLKEIIGYNLGDNIEYYIDESGLDGRSVELHHIYGKHYDMNSIVQLTRSEHIAFHKMYGYKTFPNIFGGG